MENTNKEEVKYMDLQESEMQHYSKILAMMQKKLELIKTENDNDEKIVKATSVFTKSLEKSADKSELASIQSNYNTI